MHRNTKIATCTYCGTRAALVLSADHHRLVCGACGAPLSEIKSLPMDRAERKAVGTVPTPAGAERKAKSKKKPKQKKRKSRIKGLFEEIFDEIEDIFD